MNPKSFLQIGGAVLLLVGILGFVGVIGLTPEKSIFGSAWWFDGGENWAHFVLGVVGLLASFVLGAGYQRLLVRILGWVGILVGLYSLFISSNFLGVNLENPLDTLLHLVVGVWALMSARGGKSMGMPMQSGMMQQ